MASKYGGDFNPQAVRTIKTSRFHGIDQSVDENDLRVSPECWTHNAINTWTNKGNLTVRNNFVAVTSAIDLSDGYTYGIKKLFLHAPTGSAAWLLALCEAKSAGVHHHYCLLHRKKDLSNGWAEVKCSALHSFGSMGDSVWFSNADMSFANYSGDFYETGIPVYATILTNGADLMMFYVQNTLVPTDYCLSVLGHYSWSAATVNATTNVITSTIGLTAGDTFELASKTAQIPGGASAFKVYYAVNVSGNDFKASLTEGGSAIDLTSAGANVIVRKNRDLGTWTTVTADKATSRFTLAAYAKNGNRVRFSSSSNDLPRGVGTGRYYYVVNASSPTWQVSLTEGGDPITLTTNGSNIKAILMTQYPNDPPRGKDIVIHNEKPWVFKDDTLYYGAGYYDNPETEEWDGRARPNEWYTALFAGNIPVPTWDGYTFNALREVNGRLLAWKQNTVFEIEGTQPPFRVRQLYTAAGTPAPDSICWHLSGGLFYVNPDGVQVYNGAATVPYLSKEIQDIWCADNDAAIATIVGDVLYVYGTFYDFDGETAVSRIMAVDLNTKDTHLWTTLTNAATLTVDCILAPHFTAKSTEDNVPELWFASGDVIYRYSRTAPAAGEAAEAGYSIPQKDYGSASRRKRLSKLTITGSGGTVYVAPIADGVTKTTKTIALPTKPKTVSANGYRLGLAIANDGDPVVIRDIEQEIV